MTSKVADPWRNWNYPHYLFPRRPPGVTPADDFRNRVRDGRADLLAFADRLAVFLPMVDAWAAHGRRASRLDLIDLILDLRVAAVHAGPRDVKVGYWWLTEPFLEMPAGEVRALAAVADQHLDEEFGGRRARGSELPPSSYHVVAQKLAVFEVADHYVDERNVPHIYNCPGLAPNRTLFVWRARALARHAGWVNPLTLYRLPDWLDGLPPRFWDPRWAADGSYIGGERPETRKLRRRRRGQRR